MEKQSFREDIRYILVRIINKELPPASGLYRIVEDSGLISLYLIERKIPYTPIANKTLLCCILNSNPMVNILGTSYGENFSKLFSDQLGEYARQKSYRISLGIEDISPVLTTLCWDKKCVPINKYHPD